MQNTRMDNTRVRRYRWIKLSLFFVVYSVFHSAISAPSEPEINDLNIPTDVELKKINEELKKEKVDETLTEEDVLTKDNEEGRKIIEEVTVKEDFEDRKETNGSKKKLKEATKQTVLATMPTWKSEDAVSTLRPKRNCTSQAIQQFPRPLMGPKARLHGGIIIHICVAIFTFVGLAIICDEYFVGSLDRICEELKMTPDVAGATFMAAGSSAPELATVVIGVFLAEDDIGLSGVIGSAVFNIMFVISVCALCAGTVSHLNWWPLCRDCFFYAISILVMLCTIWDGFVYWYESVIMLLFYVVYCVALYFNSALERYFTSLPIPIELPTRHEQTALVTYKSEGEKPPEGADQYTHVEGTTQETPLQNPGYTADGAYENVGYNADPAQTWGQNQSWDPNSSWEDNQAAVAPVGQTMGWDSNASWSDSGPAPAAPQPPKTTPAPPKVELTPAPQSAAPSQSYYKSKEHNTRVNPLEKPVNAGPWKQFCWAVAYPVHWSARKTMPDSRGPWYPVTFIVSMLWISFYSYFMVWMITIIGATFHIPDTVMGLTFIAAGVSVPDAMSSLAVIKEGYGDMAVSNAVGSNVFDILVCLGLPWFIQTVIISRGSVVNVISKGLVYSTLSLFSTVVFLVLATHANGWKLDRKYGIILMIWYLLFITFASLYELNVFGKFHPDDCYSDY